MLPGRNITDTANAVMRYARTSSGRKVIGGGLYATGGALVLHSSATNPNQMTNRMRVGGMAGIAGTALFASGMKSLR